MNELEEEIKKAEREAVFNKWKQKVLKIPVGGELDITCNDDRTMEENIQSWAYRRKKKGLFFRRETRGGQLFIIRDK